MDPTSGSGKTQAESKEQVQTPASPLLQNKRSVSSKNPFLSTANAVDSNDAGDNSGTAGDHRGATGSQSSSDALHQQSVKSLQQHQQQPPSAPPATAESARVVPEGFRELFFQYWQEAITYCAVFWTFGMCVAFLGPTLLDLGCMISSGIQTTTWAFTSQLFFSLLGATLSGYVVEKIDANFVLLINTTMVPITMFLLPFSRSIWSLTSILAVMGINMGFIDCIANLQMFKVFGDSVAPFLHALHFCYGMGAFVSPMISEPYLLNEDCTPFVEPDIGGPNLTVDQKTGVVMFANDSSNPASTLAEAQEMTNVRYAFWIMAAVQAPVAGLVFLLAYKMRSRGWTPAHQELGQTDPVLSPEEQAALDKKFKKLEESNLKASQRKSFMSEKKQLFFITAGIATLLFIYDGLQSSYGGFIYAYAVKNIKRLNKTEGAYLNALFWGMFALGRLLSIYLATKFTPAFMLLCNIMGCLLSITFTLLVRHNRIVLYMGTAVYGLFLSSVAPSTISMAEQYIDVTSKITSFLVVAAATGEMVFPVIVGNLFATLGPSSFLVFCTLMGFVSVIVYGAIWVVGRTTPKHVANVNSSFVWCRMCFVQKPAQQPQQHQHTAWTSNEGGKDDLELAPVPPAP